MKGLVVFPNTIVERGSKEGNRKKEKGQDVIDLVLWTMTCVS